MRFLFVVPRFSPNFGDFYTFPLGIAYVSAAMKRAGFEVRTLNLNHSARSISDLLKEQFEDGVDAVCTGGLSPHYTMVKQILDCARAIQPGILTVLGGGLLSSEPAVVMEGTGADFGIIGEGEISMCELAHALEEGLDPGSITGLIYRKDGELQETPKRRENPDIDALPWPDYQGLELETYLQMLFPDGARRRLSMAGSRSCPYECTFCYHPTGRRYRQRSLDAVFLELDHLVSTYRLDHVNIQDELFSENHARTSEFCRRIKTYGITWDIQLRVDLVTRELLKELKEAGCTYLSLGIESADDHILKSMRKHTTRAQIEQALRLTREAEIEVQGNLIFGDLEETLETANHTLDWWKEHLEYRLSIFFINVYPGTHLFREACRRGIIQDKLKFLEDGCPLVNVSRMSETEFKALGEKIDSYRNAYLYTPSTFRLLQPDLRGCCTAEISCRNCSRTSLHPDVWVFGANLITCPHCLQRHDLEPFSTFQGRYEPQFQALLAENSRLGIWGAGNIANALLKASPALRESDIPLFDQSVSRQGQTLLGHVISPPSRLEALGVDTILVASILYRDDIVQILEKRHPSVTRILTPGFVPEPGGGHGLAFLEVDHAQGNFQRY